MTAITDSPNAVPSDDAMISIVMNPPVSETESIFVSELVDWHIKICRGRRGVLLSYRPKDISLLFKPMIFHSYTEPVEFTCIINICKLFQRLIQGVL